MRRCLLRSPNLPLRPRDDMCAPPSHASGRKAILISSSFGSRAHLARDALNLSSPNCTSNRNQAKSCRSLHNHNLARLISSLHQRIPLCLRGQLIASWCRESAETAIVWDRASATTQIQQYCGSVNSSSTSRPLRDRSRLTAAAVFSRGKSDGKPNPEHARLTWRCARRAPVSRLQPIAASG
jgi:hypothetical protein